MKHLFLTGEQGAGKTALLTRLLPRDAPPCGFVTERTQTPEGLGVYLHAPGSGRRYTEANRVGSWENGAMRPHPEVFDTLGVQLLSQPVPGRPILMDELGVLEQSAPLFCGRVLELLDGRHPVLGVVKNKSCPFLDAVRSHPNVEVVWVSEHNRDALYSSLNLRQNAGL